MHKSTSNLSCGRYSSFDLTKRSISHLEDISQHASRRMAIMNEAEEQERKIVNEFCHLLEKSKQLFNGLRDLPQYGHKQWQAYFGRTFDVYTKLWKFQQQHRQVLDSKYALKRWQIGEIASKIGQLYYHYYLRTSETNYLNETFSFYAAIRARGYYSKASKEERRINHTELSPTTPDCLSASCLLSEKSDLMVKKLRYYARFIVVCLLLKKMKLVRDLVRELAKQIDDYTATYEPEDQLEWSLVLGEIKSFIEADNLVNIVDVDSTSVVLSHRLNPLNSPPVEKLPSNHLTLQEILIMGNCCDQVKFSELTLDMFRMLQTLEREPQEESTQIFDTSPAPGRIPFQPDNGDQRPAKRENPHKYLLYKPNINQLIVFLSSGFKELPPNGVLLLYMSADGCFTNIKHPEDATFSVREELEKATTTDCTAAPFTNFDVAHHIICMWSANICKLDPQMKQFQTDAGPLIQVGLLVLGSNQTLIPGYDYGGVATNSKREPDHINKRNVQLKDIHCLYPGDLYPLTRKPLFVIVDSDNSHAFQYIPRYFGQPVLVLMSPEDIPSCFHDQQHKGNLFTLFLHSPLTAVCFICNITDIPYSLWEKGQSHVDRFMSEASRLLIKCRNIDPAFLQFYGDDFLRLLILRFIFCCVVLRLHRLFMNTNFSPRSHPPLSEPEILEQPSLKKAVFELVTVLDVRNMFSEMEETD